jgi:hypothetical protein
MSYIVDKAVQRTAEILEIPELDLKFSERLQLRLGRSTRAQYLNSIFGLTVSTSYLRIARAARIAVIPLLATSRLPCPLWNGSCDLCVAGTRSWPSGIPSACWSLK